MYLEVNATYTEIFKNDISKFRYFSSYMKIMQLYIFALSHVIKIFYKRKFSFHQQKMRQMNPVLSFTTSGTKMLIRVFMQDEIH